MGSDLDMLLSAPMWRALGVDSEGRTLTATDESGSMQLVEIDARGTAAALTALGGPCAGRYLPDRRAVLVTHDNGGDERAQISLLRLDAVADGAARAPAGLSDLEPLVRDAAHVHNLVDVNGQAMCYLTNRRNGVDFDVVVRDLDSGVETVAYDGGGAVTDATMSPDGHLVAFLLCGRPALSDQVMLADLRSGEVRALTSADEPAQHLAPRFDPAGASLTMTTNRGRDMLGVARLDLVSGEWTWLAADDAHDVTGWLAPDGHTLLTCANVDGRSVVSLRSPSGSRPVALPGPGCVEGGQLPPPRWSPDGAAVALSFSGPATPGDVLLVDVATGAARPLTDSGTRLAALGLTTPEHVWIPAPDGERIPCLVHRPPATSTPGAHTGPDMPAGSSVTHVHGGPESQSKLLFSSTVAALSLAGHTVLTPNVRGSTGYGKRWYSMDDARLRLDAVADLAAVHAHLPTLGLDPARAGLWGASYGGYMVLAGLAFQPERWAAGVDIVGMSSLVTFLENTSAYRRAAREREYGALASDRDFLAAASPLSRVDDIRAPLFAVHGANDPRVPPSEARQLAEALTARGVPCELMVFDDEGHMLTKRPNRLAAYRRGCEFLAAHLAAAGGGAGGEAG